MNQRITLLAPTAGVDGAGAPVETFAPEYSVWAQKIEGAVGGEGKALSGVESSQKATLLIRFRAIDTRYRVRWNGYDWSIISADDTDGGRVSVKLELSRV